MTAPRPTAWVPPAPGPQREAAIVPSESELRKRMRDVGDAPGEIDVSSVIRRARVRRLPRVLAVGGAACLAIAAIVVPVSLSLGGNAGTTFVASDAGGGSDKSAPEAESGQADTMLRTAADQLNLCAAPVTMVPPATDGLQLTIEPIDAPANAV